MAEVVTASPKRRRLEKADGPDTRPALPSSTAPLPKTAATKKRVTPGEGPSKLPTKAPHTVSDLPRKRASGLRRLSVRPAAASLGLQVPKYEPETEEEKRRRVAETLIRDDEAAIKELQQEIARLERTHGKEKEKDSEALIARLLAANDASFTNLPEAPTFDFQAAMADPAIPSALPLPSSDPLPLLRAFSNVTFTKSLVTAVPEGTGHHHEITGFAGSAPTALSFMMELVVSDDTTVESLRCTVLPWARAELKDVIEECERSCNPQMLLWAIDSYQSLAVKRAKTMAGLCWKYPGLLPQFAAKERKKNTGSKFYKPENREVVALLGESMLCFRKRGETKGGVEFVVAWKLDVDDVGEALSRVEGYARFPEAWSEMDKHGKALRSVPTLFDNLVRERGPYDSIRCVVEMLFPDEECRE